MQNKDTNKIIKQKIREACRYQRNVKEYRECEISDVREIRRSYIMDVCEIPTAIIGHQYVGTIL